jgi:hypothetical protein
MLVTPLWMLAIGLPQLGAGESIRVSFDMPPVIACVDVTTPDFVRSHPDERLFQASWQVSTLLRQGREQDMTQILFWLESRDQPIRVEDYAPRTTLASDQAGNVSFEERKERSQGIGVAVSGFEWPAKISGSGDIGSKNSDAKRYELVPEMSPVTASGTIQSGSGVYIKLRASRSTSLEGTHSLSVTFSVPAGWCGGSVVLTCTAWAVDPGLLRGFKDHEVVCGKSRFLVALHRDGDLASKAKATRLVQAKSNLLRTVVDHREEIEKSFYPTVAHKVGVLLDVIPPRLPGDWTEQWIYGDRQRLDRDLVGRMPGSVRAAMSQYSLARRELSQPSRDAIY